MIEPEQGAMLTGCFRCELLAVVEPVCARCGGQPRWVPARMMSPELVAEHIARRVDAWEAAPDDDALVALLEDLHLYGPPARDALAARGAPSLDALARAYLALARP